jgi:hypothetical protein
MVKRRVKKMAVLDGSTPESAWSGSKDELRWNYFH